MKKYSNNYGNDFYIKEDEKLLIKHILPEYFIEHNLGEAGKNQDFLQYCLNFVQNELNSILNSFINGGFSYKGFMLYPFIKDVSKENIGKMARLKKAIEFLDENGCNFSGSIKKYSGIGGINPKNSIKRISSGNFASILSSLYQELAEIKQPFSFRKKKVDHARTKFGTNFVGKETRHRRGGQAHRNGIKPGCEELDFESYKKSDSEYLKPLNELKIYADKNLREYLCGFYLHGSLATKDYVKGWSDIDTLSIVSKKTIDEPRALLELRNKLYRARHFFYRIDPLQHHGSIAISEYDFDNYCQTYFPIPLFKYASSFFSGDKSAEFNAREYSGEAMQKLFWFVNYFRKLSIEKADKLGSYNAKALLHSITLFPSMYLQAKGILVYKKFSFDIAKKDFKKESWEIIERVSSIRRNWNGIKTLSPLNSFSKINPLAFYQLNSRIVDLIKDTNRNNKINGKDIIKSMLTLSEEAWGRIKTK